ncbi:MAG: hypothetical protein AB1631_07140 [Acidobacteriota bacterium]
MITNDERLEQMQLAINNLECSLAALKRDVYSLNPRRFALMAEPIIDHINRLRQQVDEYVGMNIALAEIDMISKATEDSSLEPSAHEK